MRAFLQRLFGRKTASPTRENGSSDVREDRSWIFPPSTLVDPAPWDRYWQGQLTHGMAGLVDIFCDDGSLVDAMRANGLRTVLCVGNGLSMEPHALAWAGFDVTALDLSPFAVEVVKGTAPPAELLARLAGGRSAGVNGQVEFVVGDLCDAACCPGPYDVVIDRKTLQLYPDEERPAAMKAVADRLSSRGVFFSHCHDGRWKPPASPRHATESWFVAQGWELWDGETPLTGRAAWLLTSTG